MEKSTSGFEVGKSPGSAVLVAFADRADAKYVGMSRFGTPNYSFYCPNHFEKTPSGFVTEDLEGRLLVKDWGGCSTEDVLRALGLNFRDLYKDAPKPSPEEARQQSARRAAAEAWHDALVVVSREAFDHERESEIEKRRLGEALANLPEVHPDGEMLCREFHRSCHQLAMAEMESERLIAVAKRMHQSSRRQASAHIVPASHSPAKPNASPEDPSVPFVSSVSFVGQSAHQEARWI